MALAIFSAPLLAFTPKLVQLKREGMLEYGALASSYTRLFDRKWVKGGDPTDESLLGNADIQSLADLGNPYASLKKVRAVPIAHAGDCRLFAKGIP